MVKSKPIRSKGKISLKRYFQKLNIGDPVAFVRDLTIPATFPSRIQGRSGIITEKRGTCYLVKAYDKHQQKTYIVQAIHLKKIQQISGK